jgi:hypothetical protein
MDSRSGAVKRHCPKSDNDDVFSKKTRLCGINTDAITLTIIFSAEYGGGPRAKRQIRCKLSDYPFDILKRIRKMFKSALPFEHLYLKWSPHSSGMYNSRFLTLTEKTIGEVGISGNDYLLVHPTKTTKADWIPPPLTGDDVRMWIEDNTKKRFLDLVSRLEICSPDEASKIFKLIRDEFSHERFDWETFKSVFPKNDKLVDSFN